jgi:tetratricopeptide (TPR) repeat protein
MQQPPEDWQPTFEERNVGATSMIARDGRRINRASEPLATTRSQPLHYSNISVRTMVPPAVDAPLILQRVDEVHTILNMLSEPTTSVVVLTGDPGAGKSILASLVYRHLEGVAQEGVFAIQRFVWLSIGPNATLPDVIAAILDSLSVGTADFLLLKPGQQITLLMESLRQARQGVFVVLDQFDEVLDAGNYAEPVGRGAVALFLEALQQDIGASRLLLTSYRSPFASTGAQQARIRSYFVSRVSMPEGVALLQQRGVVGTPQELSLVWQRCAGHVYALVLFSVLSALSGFAMSYLLDSPDYAPMWSGEVTANLVRAASYFLNPVQRTLMCALCLFSEPAPIEGIMMAIMGENAAIDEKGDRLFTFERELGVLTSLSLVQSSSDGKGERNYILPLLPRQFMLAHYLDSSKGHPGRSATSALGVTTGPGLTMDNPEAREIAVAAGHIRVAAYYGKLAQRLCPSTGFRNGPQDVEPLLAQIYHLCLGWHWQQAYDLLLAAGLSESMLQWGAWNTLIRLYAAMIQPHGILTRRDEGQVCSQLGLLYGRLGDYARSHAYYIQALAIQREIGDRHGEAVTLTNQGEILRGQGEVQQARANFEQALLLNKQEDDPHLESVLLHNLGLLSQNEKDYQQAFRYYVEALKLARRLQESFNEGMILTNMGMLLYERGRPAEALKLLFSALRLRQSIGDPGVRPVVQFLNTLEQKMGADAFARLRQG